jgi:hypothetical protein
MSGAPAALAAVGGLLLSTWAGACVLSALSPGLRATTGRPARLALGYGAGMGLTALVLFAVCLARLRPTAGLVAAALVLCGLLSAALARARARRGGRALDWRDALLPVLSAPAALAPRAPSAAGRLASTALLALAAVLVAALAALSVAQKAAFVDAHAVWMLKARAVVTDGGLDGPWLRHWSDQHDRRGYPLLWPLDAAWVHLLAGGVDDGLAKLVLGGFLAALCALLHELLAHRCPAWIAALGTALVPLALPTINVTLWGVADLPLTFFLLAALHALLPPRGTPCLTRAAFFLALAPFTKLEGAVAAGAFALAWLLAGGEDADEARRAPAAAGLRRRAPGAARLVAGAAIVAVGWTLFLRAYGVVDLVPPIATTGAALLERGAVLAHGLLASLVDTRWLLLWPLFLLALAVGVRRGGPPRVALLAAALLVGLDAGLLLLAAPEEPAKVSVALERLLFQAFPVALFATLATLLPAAGATRPEAVRAEDASKVDAARAALI